MTSAVGWFGATIGCGVVLLAAGCARADRGQCVDLISAGDLVITEVFAEDRESANASWFEIYNTTSHSIELAGLTLVHDSSSHVMPATAIDPGQFLVVGNEARPYIDSTYGAELGAFGTTGTLTLACGATEVDTATYDTTKPGHSRELSSAAPPDALFNDDTANWCDGNNTEFAAGNFGTPGQNNDCVPIVLGRCSNGIADRDSTVPQPGDLVITEVMATPTKAPSTLGEWFEVKALNSIDLNGLGLDRVGDAMARDTITSSDCIHVAAGSYVVFAQTQDTARDGGLPAGYVLGTFSGTLVSGDPAGSGDVALMVGSTVIDAVTWTRSSPGHSLQLDPRVTDPLSNDQPANFCDGEMVYGSGDFGTPGAVNAACVDHASAGTCNEGATNRAIVKPAVGAVVITEVMPNPSGDESQREWFEISNAGTAAFDLNELGLDRDDDSRTPDVIHDPSCKSVAPGGYALFARSSTNNGGLPTVDGTFGFTMVNASGNAEIVDGSSVLARATWTTTSNGVARQRGAVGFCAATTPYGDGDLGTPRASNPPCP
jgi:hypothetical protein